MDLEPEPGVPARVGAQSVIAWPIHLALHGSLSARTRVAVWKVAERLGTRHVNTMAIRVIIML
jgi:hypothetical protein